MGTFLKMLYCMIFIMCERTAISSVCQNFCSCRLSPKSDVTAWRASSEEDRLAISPATTQPKIDSCATILGSQEDEVQP